MNLPLLVRLMWAFRLLRPGRLLSLLRLGIILDAAKISAARVSVVLPESGYELALRFGSSDILIFQEVFIDHGYDSRDLPSEASVIVDLGANIGLATVYFGLRYPEARILAVEPEAENFSLLQLNAARLGTRVSYENAAVWSEDGSINLHTIDTAGARLGAWGIRVSEANDRAAGIACCYRLETLLRRSGIDGVDILKIDIEGAEVELFASDPESWLNKIRLIIIETHDRFRPGSEDAVRVALAEWYEELPRVGENLFFRRREGRQAQARHLPALGMSQTLARGDGRFGLMPAHYHTAPN